VAHTSTLRRRNGVGFPIHGKATARPAAVSTSDKIWAQIWVSTSGFHGTAAVSISSKI
jgi:hypothetical protein